MLASRQQITEWWYGYAVYAWCFNR